MDTSIIGEYIWSPIMPVILAQFAVVVLLMASIFVKKRRKVLWGTSLVLVAGLVTWYFVIPVIPVHFEPNHPDPEWDNGKVVHILPAVNDSRILLKTSFEEPLDSPRLTVDGNLTVSGTRTDTYGYFWAFDVSGLQAETTYQLQLQDYEGRPLCDPWPLKTFPAPGSEPERLRVLAIT